MKFAGEFTYESGAEPDEDVLIFSDGMMTSRACIEWGYEPAPYWVREGPDGLHFWAMLESEEHGTIRFKGVFDGEQLQAHALWRKERWYWTIEQPMKFVGLPLEREK